MSQATEDGDGGTSSVDSVSLNCIQNQEQNEVEGVALLRQIFPDESTEELKRMHQNRISGTQTPNTPRCHSSPPSVVSKFEEFSACDSNDVVDLLEIRVKEDCGGPIYSRLISRDPSIGLGLTLYECNESVRVHSLSTVDGRHFSTVGCQIDDSARGPALLAEIGVGDHLLGINGTTLADAAISSQSVLQNAVQIIRESPDPIVLHLRRNTDPMPLIGLQTPPRELFCNPAPALLDSTNLDESSLPFDDIDGDVCNIQRLYCSTPTTNMKKGGIHAIAATLAQHGVLKSIGDQLKTSRMLLELDERAREWETNSSFRIEDGWIPLLGIRQSLTVRILNSFADRKAIAYAVWVYDVDSGTEWYAPLRYWEDFVELRSTIIKLDPAVGSLDFPKYSRSLFGSPIRKDDCEKKVRVLEYFLRSLCSLIHCWPLHQGAGEIAVLVQSFLGCDAVVANPNLQKYQYESMRSDTGSETRKSSTHANLRKQLKHSLQKYTHRLLLLAPLQDMVTQFVESIRSRCPKLDHIEHLEAEGRHVLKQRAMDNLQHIQSFLDYLQNMLLEACHPDYRSIGERDEYEVVHEIMTVESDDTEWNVLVREAVREHIELEVYVPLRSAVSRWLVNGWKHEDIECNFKIKELRKRSLQFFRIETSVEQAEWDRVADILRRGVGESTLPSAKLRATVDAAREISILFQKGTSEKKGVLMGADDFLPIFIYCVVKANVERPCALCVLLRSLCGSTGMGETGYYLASFEAAIAHIQELDLSEDTEEMLQLLSVPLGG